MRSKAGQHHERQEETEGTMSSGRTAIDKHPKRSQIIDAMEAGIPCREIQRTVAPDLHHSTISRYKRTSFDPAKKMALKMLEKEGITNIDERGSEDLARATEAVCAAGPYIRRLKEREERRERWMQSAEDKADFRALSSLDRNELGDIRLAAELTGVLAAPQQANSGPYIVVIMPQGRAELPVIDDAEVDVKLGSD